MSYSKKTWVNGEIITADGLNNLEEGIAEAKKEAQAVAVAASGAQSTADDAKTAAGEAASAATAAANAAQANLESHNSNAEAHADIRLKLITIANRINAVLDSDDSTLDELSEIVAYIKSNKALIDAITIDKVNVSDIANNLVTNVADIPLSAAQGVVLKGLVDILQSAFDAKLSSALPISDGGTGATTAAAALKNLGLTATAVELNYMDGVTSNVQAQLNEKSATGHKHTKSAITDFPTSMPASDVYAWAKEASKPKYTAAEVDAVDVYGDVMLGRLYLYNGSAVVGADGTWLSYGFVDSAKGKLRGSMMLSDNNRFHINQQETGSDYAERYMLPEVATGLTADIWYRILTSKEAVTVLQGGTGATTKKGARKNLGMEIQVGVAKVGTSGTTITFPEAFSGKPVVTANGELATNIRVSNVTTTSCELTSGYSDNTVQWQAIYISD